MLSKRQLRRLAKEARVLAMECVEGVAPLFGTGRIRYRNSRPCCSAGHLCERATLWSLWFEDLYDVSVAVGDAATVLATGNDTAETAQRHGAVVFPFLALADALDDATEGSP